MDNTKEWHRLTALYRDKNDLELEELAASFQDLTQIAQQVLRDELKARVLSSPEEIRKRVSTPDPAIERSSEEEVPWILRESGNAQKLGELQAILKQAGIQAGVVSPQENICRTQLLQLQVDERDAARAEEVLAAPPPTITTNHEAREESAEDFEAPACTQCGALDPLLESVDPFNTWRCESCGAEWVEDAEDESSHSPTH